MSQPKKTRKPTAQNPMSTPTMERVDERARNIFQEPKYNSPKYGQSSDCPPPLISAYPNDTRTVSSPPLDPLSKHSGTVYSDMSSYDHYGSFHQETDPYQISGYPACPESHNTPYLPAYDEETTGSMTSFAEPTIGMDSMGQPGDQPYNHTNSFFEGHEPLRSPHATHFDVENLIHRQSVDVRDPNTLQKYGRGEPAQDQRKSSDPHARHGRRQLDPNERREVAYKRKHGVCNDCRKRKIKCNHVQVHDPTSNVGHTLPEDDAAAQTYRPDGRRRRL